MNKFLTYLAVSVAGSSTFVRAALKTPSLFQPMTLTLYLCLYLLELYNTMNEILIFLSQKRLPSSYLAVSVAGSSCLVRAALKTPSLFQPMTLLPCHREMFRGKMGRLKKGEGAKVDVERPVSRKMLHLVHRKYTN